MSTLFSLSLPFVSLPFPSFLALPSLFLFLALPPDLSPRLSRPFKFGPDLQRYDADSLGMWG